MLDWKWVVISWIVGFLIGMYLGPMIDRWDRRSAGEKEKK